MPPSAHPSTLLAPFQSLFSAPTWRKAQRLLIGTLLARGRRTVTAALRHTGQGDTPSFSLYHQVFNRARWSALKGSRCLLSLLVQTFDAAGGSLTFVIDETLERRWGRRISKRGHYRDPLASSRKRTVSTRGLRWIVLTLVITPPLCQRQCEVRLIAPLRLDAVLHEAPPPRQPGTRGRPRRKGKRLPSLVERLRDAATPWQSLRVRWYDGRVRRLQISSGTALWYRSGQPVLPLRWVLVRPCDAQHPPRAFFSTCPSDQAGDIVACFIKRWSIETTFEESRVTRGLFLTEILGLNRDPHLVVGP